MTALTENRPAGASGLVAPFDTARLDRLMEDAGLDVLLVTSKHNVQYLLGGYRFFFFDVMDAIGVSRYLPVVAYVKGRPDQAAYLACVLEGYERDLGKFWTPTVVTGSWTTHQAVDLAVKHLKSVGRTGARIGVEAGFLPADAMDALRAALPDARFADCLYVLERLRALKSPAELDLLRAASEKVVDAMLAVMASHGPGTTKRQLVEALRIEEVKRGLVFEYCLVTTGTSQNRAPSDERWETGGILSLDSGGNYKGYIGDLCRMAILGEPDGELQDLLGWIDEVQQAARRPIRSGAPGGDVFAAAEPSLAKSPHRKYSSFVAHGMGMVSHEAPRLTSSGPIPYVGEDADRPLEEGMVLSIETTMHHPTRGFIKLEDTVAVTATGYEAYGDAGRGWNRGGAR